MTTTTTTTPRPSPLPATGDGEHSTATNVGPTTPRPGEPSAPVPAAGQRRRRTDPSSARALAMLSRRPIFAAAVPQLHVGGRVADGSLVVNDRAADRRFRLYTPRLNSQFRAGYRAGLWYLRAAGDFEPSPRSPGFPTTAAALDSLRAVRRDGSAPAARGGQHCRVIWS